MGPTREKIIQLAENLIHMHGYHGFSYANISTVLNIKNAAIHYHFPNKEALGMAVLNNTKERLLHKKQELKAQNASINECITAFIQVYDKNCYTNNRMCLVGAFCSDYYLLPPLVQRELNELINSIIEWLAEQLENARTNETISFSGSARAQAAMMSSSMLGALMLNRAVGHVVYEQIKTQLTSVVICK